MADKKKYHPGGSVPGTRSPAVGSLNKNTRLLRAKSLAMENQIARELGYANRTAFNTALRNASPKEGRALASRMKSIGSRLQKQFNIDNKQLINDSQRIDTARRKQILAQRRRRRPDNSNFGPKVGGNARRGGIAPLVPGTGRPKRKPVTKRPNVDPRPPRRRRPDNSNFGPEVGRKKPVTKRPNVDPRPPRRRRKTVTKRPNVDPRPLPIRKKAGPKGQPAIPVGMQRRIAANQRRLVRGTSTNSRNLPASMQRRLAAQRRAVNQRKRSNASPTQRPSSRGNAPRPSSLRQVVGRNLSRLRGRR